MRRLLRVMPLPVVAVLAATPAAAQLKLVSLDIRVPIAPTPVAADGKTLLVYELRVTNLDRRQTKLTGIEVLAESAGPSLLSLGDSAVRVTSRLASRSPPGSAIGSRSPPTTPPRKSWPIRWIDTTSRCGPGRPWPSPRHSAGAAGRGWRSMGRAIPRDIAGPPFRWTARPKSASGSRPTGSSSAPTVWHSMVTRWSTPIGMGMAPRWSPSPMASSPR